MPNGIPRTENASGGLGELTHHLMGMYALIAPTAMYIEREIDIDM